MHHNISIIILIICFCWTSYLDVFGQLPGAQIFDPNHMHEIRVTSEDLVDLSTSISEEYIAVTATIDGQKIDSIGIKLRGSTSLYSDQKPLVLDFNKFVKGQKFDGLKKLGLRNNFKDPFLQKEALAYEFYRRAGLPSPRTSFAEVYLGDTFVGIYTLTEIIDKTFLKNNYASNDGSLYKGAHDFRGFSVEVLEGDLEAYERFEIEHTPLNLDEYVNVDHFIKQMAVDIIIGDWDSYAYHRHNFYIYYELESKQLQFINWDHNYAFSAKAEDKDFHPHGTFPSDINLIESPNLKERYENTMCELLTYVADSNFVVSQINHNNEVLNSNKNDISPPETGPLEEYIFQRIQRLKDTLSVMNITCNELVYPYEKGDLVINEVGRTKIDGKNKGWIELHNTSTKAILLDRSYYLSDDASYPKKWHFHDEVLLEPGGFHIVWTDKIMDAEGLHAEIKVDKDGGFVSMTYENMTPIDLTSYGPIKKDKSYSRVPDGTGDFIISTATLNSSNLSPGIRN